MEIDRHISNRKRKSTEYDGNGLKPKLAWWYGCLVLWLCPDLLMEDFSVFMDLFGVSLGYLSRGGRYIQNGASSWPFCSQVYGWDAQLPIESHKCLLVLSICSHYYFYVPWTPNL